MKYLFRAIFEKLIEKPINTFIHKKSEEKEATFDKNNFVAYHEPRRIILFLILFLACLGITVALCSGSGKPNPLSVGSCALSAVSFLALIYILTYRCTVDDTGFTVTKFFVLKKFIPREEFYEVKIINRQPDNSDKESLLIVKNKKGKRIFTASRDLVGFDLLCKKAKRFKRKSNV